MDQVIPVANIEVYEVTTNAATVSAEDISTEISSSTSAESTEVSIVNEDDQNPINRYCKCSSFECDCCRDFSLPLVPIRGPGCANIRYLEGDRLSVGIKFGNRVLANRIVSGNYLNGSSSSSNEINNSCHNYRAQIYSSLSSATWWFHKLLRSHLWHFKEE